MMKQRGIQMSADGQGMTMSIDQCITKQNPVPKRSPEEVNCKPDTASSKHRCLCQSVLRPPSRQPLPPNFVQYVVSDKNGRVYSGVIAGQTATSLTLRRQQGETDTLLRGDIEELASTGKSLMPEGLEKDLSRQDLADLIAYLTAGDSRP